jgi:hypothetical protein
MDRCEKCGAENPDNHKFCSECGAKFVARSPSIPVPGEEGVFYCTKHKKEPTRVSCGRCEKPICHKCMIVGPAGVRCRDCGKRKRPVRVRGMMHDAGRGVALAGASIGRRPWYFMFWFAILNFIRNLFGG